MRTSQLSAQRLKAEGGKSGTLAAHELISRAVRKFCIFGFCRTLVLFHSRKIWSGQEKKASDIRAVYCRSCTAGDGGAATIFAYGGQGFWVVCAVAGTCRACSVWKCTKLQTPWLSVNVKGVRASSQESLGSKCRSGRWCLGSLEGQHRKTRVGAVSFHVFGKQFFPYSRRSDPNLVCYC